MFLPTLTAFCSLSFDRLLPAFLRLQLAYIIESFFVQLSRCSAVGFPFPLSGSGPSLLRFSPVPFSGSVPSSFLIRFPSAQAFRFPETLKTIQIFRALSTNSFPLTLCVLCQPALWHLTRFLEAFAIFGMASFDERFAFPLISRIDLG